MEPLKVVNCSTRFLLNETNIVPISVQDRYSHCQLKQFFMPNFVSVVRIFIFTWLISGIFGNSLSFYVWYSKRQRRKNSSAIYLAALSLTDLLLIILLINYYLEQYWCLRGIIHTSVICQLYQSLFIFTQYYSIVLVFGFTLERYIAVCFPFKRHKLCTTKRALFTIFILSLFVLVPMICQSIIWEYNNGECTMRMYIIRNQQFQTFLFSQEVVFSLIVPLATFVFNLLVLNEMRRLLQSQRMSQSTQAAPAATKSSRSIRLVNWLNKQMPSVCNKSRSTNQQQTSVQQPTTSKCSESSSFLAATLMLVILSFYLIACSVPTGIVYFLQFKWIQPDECLSDDAIRKSPEWIKFLYQIKTKDIVDTICASHYACNFFIYFVTCSDFRKQVINIFRCGSANVSSEFTSKTYLPLSRRTKPRTINSIGAEYNAMGNESDKLTLNDASNLNFPQTLTNSN